MSILISVVFVVGLGMAIAGWWPTMRSMFGDNHALGCAAWLAPVCATVYAAIHREDLERELWLQLAGAGLILASAILRAITG